MKETIFHHFVAGLIFILSLDFGNFEMYGCSNTTDLVRIEVNQSKVECIRDKIVPNAEFEGVVKAIGFTGSSFTESQVVPDSHSLTWDSLTIGEVYNVSCWISLDSSKSDKVECTVPIVDPERRLARFRLCPSDSKIQLCWETEPSVRTLKIIYRDLQTPDGCISPTSTPDPVSLKTSKLAYKTVRDNTMTYNGNRKQFWISLPLDFDVAPVVIGVIQLDSTESQLTQVKKGRRTIWFILNDAHWNPVNTPRIVGVLHDGCGSCSAVLYPRCDFCSQSRKNSPDTTAKLRTLCRWGPMHVLEPHVNVLDSIAIVENTPDEHLSMEEDILTLFNNSLFSPALPMVTAASDQCFISWHIDPSQSVVVDDEAAAEGTLALWFSDYKVRVYKTTSQRFSLQGNDCAAKHVQVDVEVNFVRTPTTPVQMKTELYESIGTPQYIDVISVADRVHKVIWDSPISPVQTPHLYVVTQMYSSGKEKAVAYIPSSGPFQHTFKADEYCETFAYTVHIMSIRDGVVGSSVYTTRDSAFKALIDLRISDANATSLHLEWTVHNKACLVHSYSILASPVTNSIVHQTFSGTETDGWLEVSACTQYRITVEPLLEGQWVSLSVSKPVRIWTPAIATGAPRTLHVKTTAQAGQRVIWLQPETRTYCQYLYVVEQHSADDNEFTTLLVEPSEGPNFEADFEVSLDCVNYNYKVYILAQPENVIGPAIVQTASSTGFSHHLPSVNVKSDPDSVDVTISWSYKSECAPDEFDVTIYDLGGSVLSTETVDTNSLKLAVDVACEKLLVGVVARKENTNGLESDRVEFIRMKVPDVPENVHVADVDKSYQKISWEKPAYEYSCPHNYVITQRRERDGEEYSVTISSDEDFEFIFEVEAGCVDYTYGIRIVAENGHVQGWEVSMTVRTRPSDLKAPDGIHISTPYSNLALLIWDESSIPTACRPTYEVVLQKTSDSFGRRIVVPEDQYMIGLSVEQCTGYVIHVEAMDRMDYMKERVRSDPIVLRTATETPGTPSSLKVIYNTPSSQTLQWTSPGYLPPCAKYELVQDNAEDNSSVTVRLEKTITSYKFSSLESSTNYTYKIRAVAEDAHGPFSTPVSLTTDISEHHFRTMESMYDINFVSVKDTGEREILLDLHLTPLSKVPHLQGITLRVEPQVTPFQTELPLVNQTSLFPENLVNIWEVRASTGKGPWEVLVWQQPSDGNMEVVEFVEQSNLADVKFRLGQYGVGCVATLPCTNVPLRPGTRYSIQLIMYTAVDAAESIQRLVTTHQDGSLVVAVICYVVLISIAAIATTATLYFTKYDLKTLARIREAILAAELLSKKTNDSYLDDDVESSFVDLAELPTYLDKCLRPHSAILTNQFHSLRNRASQLKQKKGLTIITATKSKNTVLNRQMDVLPYDQNIATLEGELDEEGDTRYINASLIQAIAPFVRRQQISSIETDQPAYIATQAPLPDTIGDFWRLIYQENVTVIIMLAPSLGENLPDFEIYWPPMVDECRYHAYDTSRLTVTLVAETAESGYMLRKFTVTSLDESEDPLEVTQFQLLNWPEHGLPNIQEFIGMLTAYRRFKYSETDQDAPTLVHCSNGAGRTGAFIAADTLMDHLEESAESIDLASIVTELRGMRMNMVQKNVQYVFLHMFAKTQLA
ncbi:hypothetical protein CRM22_007825 [Opisthorchis felineus]|uniref:Uncharacterized protein n=1 Tax=Opisthorchis felineus TaxID=147828 RepID=A0A4S2LEK9_OPIFE|nr:hypothetical protein CRM22_007825 [Opisthorchis felineus]TGZ61761.1 hypothetical protein CRM22_007825 [Opisthorchis felineus]